VKRNLPISLLLHAVVLGLLALLGGTVQASAWKSPELIRVRFAGPGGPGGGRTRLVTPPTAAPRAEADKPAPPKPEPGTRHLPKAPPQEKKKPKPASVTPKGYAPDAKDSHARPDANGRAGGVPGGKGSPGVNPGGGPQAGGTDQPFPFDWYLALVQERISRNWNPIALSQRACAVHFFIQGDGRIVGVTLSETSGEPMFDREALRALTATDRLPPLPAGFGSRTLGVTFYFSSAGSEP
jgi:TonB family protein